MLREGDAPPTHASPTLRRISAPQALLEEWKQPQAINARPFRETNMTQHSRHSGSAVVPGSTIYRLENAPGDFSPPTQVGRGGGGEAPEAAENVSKDCADRLRKHDQEMVEIGKDEI